MDVLATHHIAIYTPQFDLLKKFYTEVLGFPVTRRWDDVGIIFIGAGSTQIELIRRDQDDGNVRPHALDEGVGLNHLAFHVADVDATFRELAARGVRAIRPPADFQSVRIAFIADPDGNVLELVEELPSRV